MKVAVYYKNSDIRVEDVDDIPVDAGEVKVKVMACGVCGSDVMEWYRIKKAGRPGGIGAFGHECTGIVTEVGPKAAKKVQVGERVVVTHHVPCNTCNACITGHTTACQTLQSTKFKNNFGAYAEHVVLPEINVDRGILKLPESVSFDEGTFVEPLGCVIRGQQWASPAGGKSVLVIGAGLSGLLHVQAARLNGAGFIAVSDLNTDRLKVAARFGADATIVATEDVPKMFKEINGGWGADVVIMAAPVPACVKQSLEAVGRGHDPLLRADEPRGQLGGEPVELVAEGSDDHPLVRGGLPQPADRAAVDTVQARQREGHDHPGLSPREDARRVHADRPAEGR